MSKVVRDKEVQEDFREFRERTQKLKSLCEARDLSCEIKFNVKTTKWLIEVGSTVPMESYSTICRGVDVNNTLDDAIRHVEKLG